MKLLPDKSCLKLKDYIQKCYDSGSMPCNKIAKTAYQGPESVNDDPDENGMMQVDFLPQKPLIAKELDNTFIAAEETIAPAMDVDLDSITTDADVVVNHDAPEEFMMQEVDPLP